jgi:phospholipase/carboxylesterase
MRIEQLGGLRVRITGGTDREGGGQGPVVVLLHGFGAPGDDLVSLWRALRAPPGTRFVFPEAPLSLASMGMPGGRAWWMIDIARFQRARTPQDMDERMAEVPAGLADAREHVVAMLGELDKTLRPSKLVLGGFSQGSMLSVDVALRTSLPLAGLVVMSGALIAASEWTELAPKRKGLAVLQSHGTRDPILPLATGEKLRDVLTSAGLDGTWVPFHGEHAIPGPVLDAVGVFLERHLAA